jgi:hypothetical protein
MIVATLGPSHSGLFLSLLWRAKACLVEAHLTVPDLAAAAVEVAAFAALHPHSVIRRQGWPRAELCDAPIKSPPLAGSLAEYRTAGRRTAGTAGAPDPRGP